MPSQEAFHRVLIAWFDENGRQFPWRESRDPYSVLIGEILLQRTRGENVAPVYPRFINRWPTPEALAIGNLDEILKVIAPLGLSKRAASLRSLGEALVDSGHDSWNPQDLLLLPGVGPYAAHAVPVFSLDRKLPLVDWVIARVI